MIIELLFDFVLTLLEFLFGWVEFPAIPAPIEDALYTLLNYISGAMDFVFLIVPSEIIFVGLPIVLVVENFDKLYSVIMWIVRKIPFLGME